MASKDTGFHSSDADWTRGRAQVVADAEALARRQIGMTRRVVLAALAASDPAPGSHQPPLPSSAAQQAPAVEAEPVAQEPVAWRVYGMMRQGAPNNVKARGIGSDPTEYLYPGHREADARECARLMRGEVQPLYSHPATTPPAPVQAESVERHTPARCVILNRASTDLEKIINGHDPEVHHLGNRVWDRLDKMAIEIEALTHPSDAESLRAERESLRGYVERLTAGVEEGDKQIDALLGRCNRSEAERGAAQARVAELEAALSDEQRANASLLETLTASQAERDRLYALTPPPDAELDALVNALRSGEQADMDGCVVRVSRQACEEAADAITALRARPATVQVKPLVWEELPKAGYAAFDDVFKECVYADTDDEKCSIENVRTARIRAALAASDPAPGSHQPPLPSSAAQGGEV